MTVHLLRRTKHIPLPKSIAVVERVEKLNIVVITVSHRFTLQDHISALITKCSCSLYALQTICAHGLYGNTLWDIHVTRSNPVSQVKFARPA